MEDGRGDGGSGGRGGNNQVNDFEDPVRFVYRTWPWREDVAGLPQALRPVLGPVSGLGTCSVSNRGRWKKDEPKNDDPLVKMF